MTEPTHVDETYPCPNCGADLPRARQPAFCMACGWEGEAPGRGSEDAWDREAEAFHARHPEVMSGLLTLCRRWRERGHDRWGIGAAFEVLRWERRMQGLPDAEEEFKLNHNYRAWYARRIMENYRSFAEPPIFALRVRRRRSEPPPRRAS